MVRRLLADFEEIAGAALLSAMCLVAGVQVVGRYVLSTPPAWTEELATLLFAWLVFVGASLALKKNEHFALDAVLMLLPFRCRRAVRVCILVLVLLFCVLLIGSGWRLAAEAWRVDTAVMEIPRTWMYAAVPFGGFLMLVRTVEALAGRRPARTDAGAGGGADPPA